jgi:hypothetical protein
MDIQTLILNLDNTIKGKRRLRDIIARGLDKDTNDAAFLVAKVTVNFLDINIEELEKILADALKIDGKIG